MDHKLVIRLATVDDIDQMLEVEQASWEEGTPQANAKQFISRIKTFPEGQLVGCLGERIVGVINSMRVKGYDLDNPIPTWEQVTAGGYIEGMHSDEGDVLYGVNMSVAPDSPRGVGTQLLLNQGMITVRRGLRFMVTGGRMPDYHKYKDAYPSAEDYVKARDEKNRLLDSQIRMYTNIKGVKLGALLPGYMADPASCDYGVLIIWFNPFKSFPRFTHKRLSNLVKRLI